MMAGTVRFQIHSLDLDHTDRSSVNAQLTGSINFTIIGGQIIVLQLMIATSMGGSGGKAEAVARASISNKKSSGDGQSGS